MQVKLIIISFTLTNISFVKTTFYKLKVKEIEKSTSDCSIISFDVPKNLQDTFQFIQGQYLTLKTMINGEEVRRSYSLCSSPLDNEWKVGIKKVEEGKFSTFANEVLQVGDELEVLPPDGNFYTPVDNSKQRNFVAFAAGSGITPMLSIIKTHLASELNSTFKLFYVNQKASSVILKEELEALKNSYMSRFEIYYFLTRQQRNIPFLNGRMDQEKLDVIFKAICDKDSTDHYFICGPEAMIHLINDHLTSLGEPKEKVHFELFGTDNKATDQKKEKLAQSFKGKACDLTIIEGGKNMSFQIEQGSNNVLDAALNNSADLPFACKGGVCATCKAKIVEGNVDMLLSYGLEPDEIEAGYILTCQSIPTSDKLVVDFDV